MKRAMLSTFACVMLFFVATDLAHLDGDDDHPGMSVIDGDGRRIGPLVDASAPMVAFKVGGRPVILGVDRLGFGGFVSGSPTTTNTTLFWETTDCSGPAFTQDVPDPVHDLTPRTYLVGMNNIGGGALMVQDGEPRPVDVLSGSGDVNPGPEFCFPTTGQFVGQPIRFEANLYARFPPPFRIRFER